MGFLVASWSPALNRAFNFLDFLQRRDGPWLHIESEETENWRSNSSHDSDYFGSFTIAGEFVSLLVDALEESYF